MVETLHVAFSLLCILAVAASAACDSQATSSTVPAGPQSAASQPPPASSPPEADMPAPWKPSAESRPFKVREQSVPHEAPGQLVTFKFVRYRPAHGGPAPYPIEGEPTSGTRMLAEATLFAPDQIDRIRLELVPEGSSVGAPLAFIRRPLGADDGSLFGVVDVPAVPFTIRGVGIDRWGQSFQVPYEVTFHPTSEVSPGLEEVDREGMDVITAKAATNPDGYVVLPHIGVSNASYEPLRSAKGDPIGLRITYDFRTSADAVLNLTPHVVVRYEPPGPGVPVEMRAVDARVAPEPGYSRGMREQVGFLATFPATYKAGVTYHIQTDLLPTIVNRNAAGTKYCLVQTYWARAYPNAAGAWEKVTSDAAPRPYRVFIEPLEFQAETDPILSMKELYQSFLEEGAQDCGEAPKRDF